MKPPRLFDGSKTRWGRCGHCLGWIGTEGLSVLHTEPACSTFAELLREYGAKLEDFKDISRN